MKLTRISAARDTRLHSMASLLILLPVALCQQESCQRVLFGQPQEQNIACLCNSLHCDKFPNFQWPTNTDPNSNEFVRLTSDRQGTRFHLDLITWPKANSSPAKPTDFVIEVRASNRKQQVLGFGGSFTDSAAQNILKLEPKLRNDAIEGYFSPTTGLGYSLGRVPIGGTDMSSRAYSLDDGPEDLALANFRLQDEDLSYKIPLISLANGWRNRDNAPNLKLMATSWSPPAWMKSNHNLVQGKLIGNSTSGPYYAAYARYLVKFLEEYEKRNVTIWMMSPQNEPNTPRRVPDKINFNSVIYEPNELADFVANSLVPELKKAGKTKEQLKLLYWDDTLDGLAEYQSPWLSNPLLRDSISAVSIHWYATGLKEKPYSLLEAARRRLPRRYGLISTEASFIGRPKPGDWQRAERYAMDIIENLRCGGLGWIDWNLALDTSGGPTWAGNHLDAAILVNQDHRSFLRNPMYYALGHVSRFVLPGAHIVDSRVLPVGGGSGSSGELVVVASEQAEPVQGDDGRLLRRMSLIILNRAGARRQVSLRLRNCRQQQSSNGRRGSQLEIQLNAKSITSLAFVC